MSDKQLTVTVTENELAALRHWHTVWADFDAVSFATGVDLTDLLNRLAKEGCEPSPSGGFDGVLVTFGDGTDDDTVETVFGRVLTYTVRLTFTNGEQVDAKCEGLAREGDPSELVVKYRQFDDELDETVGDLIAVPFDDVAGIYIF